MCYGMECPFEMPSGECGHKDGETNNDMACIERREEDEKSNY